MREALNVWPEKAAAMVRKFFRSVGVSSRHLSMSVERYHERHTFRERSEIFAEQALCLSLACVTEVLEKADISVQEISHIISTTVTGVMVPTLDTRVMNRLEFSRQVKRSPMFGLGCVAGAACVARGNDYLKAHPHEVLILLGVELCSLAIQRSDVSIANLISTALFADGAAATLMVGRAHPLFEKAPMKVIDSRSVFFPNTERVMGWDIGDEGFQVVLGPEVPHIVHKQLAFEVRSFLEGHNLRQEDIQFWVAHPGGPKVIDAMQSAFALDDAALARTRHSLDEVGNLSSVSVLHVCQKFLSDEKFQALSKGTFGVMLAMGPGFCAELVLLQK